jgi:dipeptidyl aminopeptidase/acylaminoacyl peptidase
LIGSSVGLSSVQIDGDKVYWLESRADERGRISLWRRLLSGGEPVEVTPSTAYVRDRVHEYGGGEYHVSDGTVVYSEFSDGRLYAVRDDTTPRPITPEGALRFGDIRVHPDWDLVLAVREDHSGVAEPINTIVALDLDGPNSDGGTVLCSGADFYSTPELSANGRLAWTQWNHPNMPWDSTTIMIGSLSSRVVTDSQAIAGGTSESALQPRWLGEKLIFASDRTNWWNLYLWSDGQVKPLHETEAEFCAPQWTLGQRPYAIIDDDHLLCTVNRSGEQSIEVLQISSGTLRSTASPGVATTSLDVGGRCAAAVLSFPDQPAALALLDLDRDAWDIVRSSFKISIPIDAISLARRVSWTSEGREIHGYFYPPVNTNWQAPAGTLPPMITLIHGGPTGFASPEFKIGYQFWTSRGFAILDVNYSGSAGGFTALAALTMSNVFNAAISQYGITDLEALAKDTHKFESRYVDSLIGPYPEDRQLYIERSPINHLDQLSAPILLLQGMEDAVVPPEQAEMLAAAARRRGLPVALIMFEGEGHGFRRAETIKAAIEAQIYFLGRIFGFEPADQVPPISIDNLSR